MIKKLGFLAELYNVRLPITNMLLDLHPQKSIFKPVIIKSQAIK